MRSPIGSERYTIDRECTLQDAMRQINLAESRVIFVVRDGHVEGCLSDGDIRRALLAGVAMDASVQGVMNVHFVSAQVGDSPAAIHHLFRRGVSAIPLLDRDGNFVEILTEDSRSVIPIAQPDIGTREVQLVNECLRTGWISSSGRFIDEFEEDFGRLIGAEHCVAVSSGTTALVTALKALGLGPGDEVILPDLTFGATANAVVQVGATPVLVDVLRDSWCIDPAGVERVLTASTRAILPVHLYGRAAPMDELLRLASRRELLVIEDCAESLGTYHSGAHVGTGGDAAAFSFFANKTITTGEGGMAVFKSRSAAESARAIRSHGYSPSRRYWHDVWGSNFRMTNLQAAIGIGQLERAESIITRKQEIGRCYTDHLLRHVGIGLDLPSSPTEMEHSYWLYSLLLPAGSSAERVAELMLQKGIECRRVFYPLHVQPAFLAFAPPDCTFPVSNEVSERGLSLPTWPGLSNHDVEFIASSLIEVLSNG